MKFVTEEQRQKQREQCRRWYALNREKHIARMCELQKANRPAKNKSYRKWWSQISHIKNDQYRVKRKEWRDRNRDRLNERSREWAKNNRPSRRALEAKRRVLETAAAINLKAIKAWMRSVMSNESSTCYYCQQSVLKKDIHFDHIVPLSKGGNHSPENLCVSCRKCNKLKSNKLVTAWIKVGQQLLAL